LVLSDPNLLLFQHLEVWGLNNQEKMTIDGRIIGLKRMDQNKMKLTTIGRASLIHCRGIYLMVRLLH
jgi:hypothetical protein